MGRSEAKWALRAEWLLLWLAALPVLILFPSSVVFKPIYDIIYNLLNFLSSNPDHPLHPFSTRAVNIAAYLVTIFLIAAPLVGMVLLSSAYNDRTRKRKIGVLRTLTDPSEFSKIESERTRAFLADLVVKGRVSVATRDSSVSACVIGINRPCIVISLGLYVMLRKGSLDALAIVAHEWGHIRNWDKFMMGTFGVSLVLFSSVSTALLSNTGSYLDGSLEGGIRGAVAGVVLKSALERREFYADLAAVSVTRSTERYIFILNSMKEGSDNTLSHPSMSKRMAFLKGFPQTASIGMWGLGVLLFGTLSFAGLYQILWDATLSMDRLLHDRNFWHSSTANYFLSPRMALLWWIPGLLIALGGCISYTRLRQTFPV